MKHFLCSAGLLVAWLVLGAENTSAQAKSPPWMTRGAVPTDQILLLSPKGTVKADTTAGKDSIINADLGDAKERTGVVVAGSQSTASTGTASSALVLIPAAGVAKLDADTEVRLPAKPDPKLNSMEQAKEQATSHNLELLKGRLFLNIDPEQVKQRGPATFRLKTPSALLAVKGTEFFSETTEQGDLVGVHEGAVVVYHPVTGDSVTLAAGQAVTITAVEISKPRALS
ncbi:MAG TPA: FecR family protein, partial [Prosthecobacter sp.]|nr:FecR family protein [Prosthecobacter sp.]